MRIAVFALLALVLPGSSPGSAQTVPGFVVPDGADPTGARDSTAALQAALAAHAGQTLCLAPGRYLSAGLVVPARTALVCAGAETTALVRPPGAVTATAKPLVAIAGPGAALKHCTLDANAPAAGNWWAGIQAAGDTSHVEIDGNRIVGPSYSCIDYGSGGHRWTHTDIAITNNVLKDCGWNGISAFVASRLVIRGNSVVSTGYNAYAIEKADGFVVEGNTATKAGPPRLVFSGPGAFGGVEKGMLLWLSPDIADGVIADNRLVDNRRAGEDGIGLGENGATSRTPSNVGRGPQTFTLDADRDYYAGERVTIVPRARPFDVEMSGTVASLDGRTLTVTASGVRGAGHFADWSINTEPRGIAIRGNTVTDPGLFGIDSASNFTVTDNLVTHAPQRCLDIELDYGGVIRSTTITGNICRDTGETRGSAYGVFLGSSAFNIVGDVVVTGNSFTDRRPAPGINAAVGVDEQNLVTRDVRLEPNDLGTLRPLAGRLLRINPR